MHVQPALQRQAAGVRVDHVVRGACLAAAAQQKHLRRLRGAVRVGRARVREGTVALTLAGRDAHA